MNPKGKVKKFLKLNCKYAEALRGKKQGKGKKYGTKEISVLIIYYNSLRGCF